MVNQDANDQDSILPRVDVTKQQSLSMTPPDLFPNACSDWKITQASQLAILDDRTYTFIPNLQGKVKIEPSIFIKYIQYLPMPRKILNALLYPHYD